MPVIQSAKGKDRTPIPPGEYVLTLVEVRAHEQDDTFHPNEDGSFPKRMRLIWQFEAAGKTDIDGDPLEYAEWTGPYYGNPKAKLTGFLDQLLPDANEEAKSALDTDALVGKRFKVKIANQRNQKGDFVPKALFFEPVA